MSTQSRMLGDSGEWIVDTIKRNPEALLLLAAGAVLMMRTTKSQLAAASPYNAGMSASERFNDGGERAAQTMQSTAASYASSASDAVRETMDTAKSYASSASDYAGQARRAVGEQSQRVVEQTRSVAQGILQSQPLAIAVAGVAAGVALAAAFPPTDIEKQTLGPLGDQVSKAAEQMGDQLKQATVKAGEKLKSSAADRGLSVDGLKEVAGEVADTFKSTMTDGPDTGTRGNFPSSGTPTGERNRQ
jgi:hypothetical protein